MGEESRNEGVRSLSTAEIVGLALGSAVIAALITGWFARSTTNALIEDQRNERREAAGREEKANDAALVASETDQFVLRYVAGGLELVASQLDRASHQVDVEHRRAKRLRAITRGLSDIAEPKGSLRDLLEVRGMIDPPQPAPVHVTQSSLVAFPGDYMQAGLLLNRCIALADDFLQRFAWTNDEKIDAVDRYLRQVKTVLAASARRYEAAALVVRQMPPRRHSEWSAATINDSRLIALGQQLVEMVDDLLAREHADPDN